MVWTGSLSVWICASLVQQIWYSILASTKKFLFQVSAHSSFENEAAFNQMAATGLLSPEELVTMPNEQVFLSSTLPAMSNVTQLAALNGNLENLTNLASVASSLASAPPIPPLDTNISRASLSPAMSDSGISVDAASTNSNNSATMLNIAAMAKMGSVGLGGQGEQLLKNLYGAPHYGTHSPLLSSLV